MRILPIIVGFLAACVALLLLINDQNTSGYYQGIWVLPLTFVFILFLMSSASQFRRSQFGFTFAFLAGLFFVRLVITPLAIHLAGPDYMVFAQLGATREQLYDAMLLISWESIATALFFLLVAKMFTRETVAVGPSSAPMTLKGSQIVYGLVALLGVALIVTIGIPSGLLNFATIAIGTVETERSSLDMLLVQIMIAGAWLSYLLVLHREGLRYRYRSSSWSFAKSLVLGVLLLLLIFGDRRSVQVYTAIAVAATLFVAFPDRKQATLTFILIATVAVIAAISYWRIFERYDLELTSGSLIGESFIASVATSLQSYAGGPFQVAAANSVLIREGIGIENVAFDFARSTFGLNFLIDESRLLTSQIMNNNIYQGKFLTGWLVFTTSYGTATLGVVLMPLFLILNISLAMWCERIFRNAKGIEVRFLFIYLFARMALLPFVATPTLISFFTIQLFTIGLVFFVATRLKGIDYPYTRKMSWT